MQKAARLISAVIQTSDNCFFARRVSQVFPEKKGLAAE